MREDRFTIVSLPKRLWAVLDDGVQVARFLYKADAKKFVSRALSASKVQR